MDSTSILLFTVAIGAAVIAIAFWAIKKGQRSQSVDEQIAEPTDNGKTSSTAPSKSTKKPAKWSKGNKRDDFKHPWLMTTLKGHVGNVLDMAISSNSKHLVSTGDDRSILLWATKDWSSSVHQPSRGTIDLDTARRVAFASDGKALLVAVENANTLQVYKTGKRDGGSGYQFSRVESVDIPTEHKGEIVACGIDVKGNFMMSASSDNIVVMYSLKGDVLKTMDTKQSSLYHAMVSPCGRLVATSGFTPDVRVWHVDFDRTGNLKGVNKAFQLTGHTSGIYSFDMSAESARSLTASKDGTFNVYDTAIRFEQGESAHLLYTGQLPELKTIGTPTKVIARIAPDGQSIAISVGSVLKMFVLDQNSIDNKLPLECETIADIHSCAAFTQLQYTPDSEMLLTSADKHIRVFHNVCGWKSRMIALQRQRPMNDAHSLRIKAGVEDLRGRIAKIENM